MVGIIALILSVTCFAIIFITGQVSNKKLAKDEALINSPEYAGEKEIRNTMSRRLVSSWDEEKILENGALMVISSDIGGYGNFANDRLYKAFAVTEKMIIEARTEYKTGNVTTSLYPLQPGIGMCVKEEAQKDITRTPKHSSVTGSAVVGGIIGGSTGAIVGAIHATEQNKKGDYSVSFTKTGRTNYVLSFFNRDPLSRIVISKQAIDRFGPPPKELVEKKTKKYWVIGEKGFIFSGDTPYAHQKYSSIAEYCNTILSGLASAK